MRCGKPSPSTFGSLCDESEVHVDAESTAVELDDAGQDPAPRWARIKEAAEQADALTVEEAECSVDDPFAGGDRRILTHKTGVLLHGTLAKDPVFKDVGQKQVPGST